MEHINLRQVNFQISSRNRACYLNKFLKTLVYTLIEIEIIHLIQFVYFSHLFRAFSHLFSNIHRYEGDRGGGGQDDLLKRFNPL